MAGSTEQDFDSLEPFERLPDVLPNLSAMRLHLTRFMTTYQFAIHEVETKVKILQQEFQLLHRYNPIEHIATRLKTPESVFAKANRLGCGSRFEDIGREIRDIAGVRVVCSFTSDVYRVQEMLCQQADVELLQLKDYIANPKPSGYRSLHAIVRVPVFLSTEQVSVPVELQFRTIAQDFWASLEHKIFYKYDKEVPEELQRELQQAAEVAARLDVDMERLSIEIQQLSDDESSAGPAVTDQVAQDFLAMLSPPRDPHQPDEPE